MGSSHSTEDVVNDVREIAETTENVHYASVMLLNGRLYIFIGETHEKMNLEDLPILKKFRQWCDAGVNMDIFVEAAYNLRQEYRHRETNTDANIEQEMKYIVEEKGNSLELQREATKLNCDRFRVHVVDVRTSGIKHYAYFVRPKLSTEVQNKLNFTFALSLQTLTDLVLKITKSSATLCTPEIRARIQTAIHDYTQQIKDEKKWFDFHHVWNCYSYLVDIYLINRMCRSDNHPICIFYGGENHAIRCFETLKEVPGVDIKFEYTAKRDSEEGPDDEEGPRDEKGPDDEKSPGDEEGPDDERQSPGDEEGPGDKEGPDDEEVSNDEKGPDDEKVSDEEVSDDKEGRDDKFFSKVFLDLVNVFYTNPKFMQLREDVTTDTNERGFSIKISSTGEFEIEEYEKLSKDGCVITDMTYNQFNQESGFCLNMHTRPDVCVTNFDKGGSEIPSFHKSLPTKKDIQDLYGDIRKYKSVVFDVILSSDGICMYTIYSQLFKRIYEAEAEDNQYNEYFDNIKERVESAVSFQDLTEKELRNIFNRLFTSDYPQINLWYKKF